MDKQVIKICVVTTVPYTLKVFLIDQLVYFSQHGYEVTVVCDYDADFARECPQELIYHPLYLKRNIGLLSTFIAFIQLFFWFKKENYDIVQYCTPKAALISSIASSMVKTPVRLYCQWGIRYVGFRGPTRAFFKSLEKLVCYLSTDIAPDSRGNLDFSVKEGLYQPNKAAVVHNGSANGVNLEKFDLSKKDVWQQETRLQSGIPDDAFVFGFLGRLCRDKGIHELIKAFIELAQDDPHIYLLLVGPLEAETLASKTLKCLSDYPRILYIGPQNQPEKYLAAMDIMVLPSYREGFGIVLIEAQAMGIPVISTRIPGPGEAMIEGQTGIMIPVADSVSLYEAMKRVRHEPAMVKEMSEKAFAFVQDNFEQKAFWEKVIDHRRNLYYRRSR